MSQVRRCCPGTHRPSEAPGIGVLSGLRIEKCCQCDQCGCTFPSEDADRLCPCDQFEARPGQWHPILPGLSRDRKYTALSWPDGQTTGTIKQAQHAAT